MCVCEGGGDAKSVSATEERERRAAFQSLRVRSMRVVVNSKSSGFAWVQELHGQAERTRDTENYLHIAGQQIFPRYNMA